MRILLLNDDSLPSARGGAAVIVDQLKKKYQAKGHEVVLITTHQDKAKDVVEKSAIGPEGSGPEREDKISIYSNYPLKKRHKHCIKDPKMSEMLNEIFEELKPDAVHAHNIHTYLTYDALNIAKKFTDKIVLTAHDTFLVSIARVNSKRNQRLASNNKAMKMRPWEHLLAVGRKYYPERNKAIRKILADSGTQVIAISNAVAEFLNVNGIKVALTIPNGIASWDTPSDTEVNEFRNKNGITGPAVLFTGRVREDKGIDAFLSAAEVAMKDVPTAKFVINGEQENVTPHLEKISPDLKQAVISTGWLDRDQASLSYYAADVVTVPSLYLDNFPTVNLEAMNAGKPVVGTCFGGTAEIVVSGETGFIVNPRNTLGYAQALIRLLNDSELAKQMGEKGKERVESQFSLERQANAYLATLSEL